MDDSISVDHSNEFIIQDVWKRIANRPALIILILELIGIVFFLFRSALIPSVILFIIFLIAPVIPAVLLENRWEKEIYQNKLSTSSMFSIIRSHRLVFILSGFIVSFLIIPVGFFLKLLVKKGNISGEDLNFTNINLPSSQASLIALIFIILIAFLIGISVSASFYRVRAEEYETGKRYNFISSPSQVSTLACYSYIGTYLGLWLLWAGLQLNLVIDHSSVISDKELNYYEKLPLEIISFWSIVPIFVIITTFYITIIFTANIIPELIDGNSYVLPTRKQLNNWSKSFLIYIVLIFILGYLGMEYGNRSSTAQPTYFLKIIINYTFILGTPLIMYLMASKYPMNGTTCTQCNMILIENNCQACSIKLNRGFQFKLKIASNKIHHPTCPACGEMWGGISRKCVSCDFTIVLSCEKCSQTLNPLWQACNLCGEPRKTIPELAMQSPGSPGYARSQAFLLVLAAMLFPALILQISIIVGTIRNESLVSSEWPKFLFDDYARVILLFITCLCIIVMILVSFNERKRPMMLVANKIAIFPSTILILSSIMYFTYFSIEKLVTSAFTNILNNLFMFLFAGIFLYTSLTGYYRSLQQFRPVVAFDPSLAIDRSESIL